MSSHLKDFVDVAETAGSVTEVSVRMHQLGYWYYSTNVVRAMADVLQEHGVEMRVPARSELPDYVETETGDLIFQKSLDAFIAAKKTPTREVIYLSQDAEFDSDWLPRSA